MRAYQIVDLYSRRTHKRATSVYSSFSVYYLLIVNTVDNTKAKDSCRNASKYVNTRFSLLLIMLSALLDDS